ncbi:MAG: hypothetical protein QOF02_2334 [Blastocatellia bacterium]|jgi:hypothetical protein|nr:hypothetical protein [Blastocatellia bacterium]
MPKKKPEDFEYLSNNPDFVPDPEIEEFMEEEISRAPKDPELLARRLRNSNTDAPQGAGDPDSDWNESTEEGEETPFGDNPTPDQSMVEENAAAVGVSYEDNEDLEFIDKIDRRDRDRYELDERSKSDDDTI